MVFSCSVAFEISFARISRVRTTLSRDQGLRSQYVPLRICAVEASFGRESIKAAMYFTPGKDSAAVRRSISARFGSKPKARRREPHARQVGSMPPLHPISTKVKLPLKTPATYSRKRVVGRMISITIASPKYDRVDHWRLNTPGQVI